MGWRNVEKLDSRSYVCGHCGNRVGSSQGFKTENARRRLHICPHCDQPTYVDEYETEIPSVAPGEEVQNVPEELANLYREARNCVSAGANTASVLTCRKILMNIAVNEGADPGLNFFQYVEYLANQGYVPPNGRGWVDHIRRKGNEATHEIALMSRDDAEELITFAEMLLKFIYEFPARVPGS